MITAEWVIDAAKRIQPIIEQTPVTKVPQLDILCKWENYQKTGSFKLRGASNKVLSLEKSALKGGLVACSAGNHGQGVAFAAASRGSACMVFVPENTSASKIDAMRQFGADVRLVRGGYVEAEKQALAHAQTSGKTFISPYNDAQVIAGQGTIGPELVEQLGGLDGIRSLVVPVGGGGLISGIGVYLSNMKERPQLIGVQSETSPYAHRVYYSGTQTGVTETESIAEGLAGEIAHDSITIPLMRRFVDDIVLVSEEEIRSAIRYCWKKYGVRIEGSAAVGLAARLAGKIQLFPAALILTGGNIQSELFNEIIHSK